MLTNEKHTLAMAFLLIGADLSPNTHSLVVDSFKNPPASFATTYQGRFIKDRIKSQYVCLFIYKNLKQTNTVAFGN